MMTYVLAQDPAPPAPCVAAAVSGGAGGLAAQRVHLLHPRQGETPRNLRQRSRAVSVDMNVKDKEKMSIIFSIFSQIFVPVSPV